MAFERDGRPWARFEVHPLQGDRAMVVRCEAPVAESRHVIRERLVLGEQSWEVELTLAHRDAMRYRMLLARQAMVGRILVDPEGSLHLRSHSADEGRALHAHVRQREAGLRIVLLVSHSDLCSSRRLIEAGEERGHQMRFLNIRQFESMGVPSLNSAQAITASRDKLFASQEVVRAGLNTPVTGFADSPLDTVDLIRMVGGTPLIVKLLEGVQGKGVVLAETQKAAESVINALQSLDANLLVQEFIKEAGGTDLRCFVVGGKVVAAIERRAAEGEFRANLHQGGTARTVQLDGAEKQMAIKACKALGLDVAGVDILRSRRGPLLLEVNSSPGLEGIETATGLDLAGKMIRQLERKLGWGRTPAGEDAMEAGQPIGSP